MGALVTSLPIEVDPVNFSRQTFNEINPMGPRLYGSALYLVFITSNPPPQDIWVFSSTDGGDTWTPQNTGHPVGNGISGGNDINVVFGASKIGILYSPDAGQFAIIEFTPPSTYGAIGAEITPSATMAANSAFYQKSDGTYVVVWQNSGGIYSVTSTVVAWGTPASRIADGAATVWGGAVDPADAGHIVYVSGVNFKYFRLSSAFAVTGPTTLGTLTISGFIGSRPTVLIWNSNVIVCWIDDNKTLNVSIGTPLTGPSFTNYVIATATGAQQLSYGTVLPDKDGNLTVKWVLTDYSGSPVVDRILQSTFDGVSTWGAPILFYDEVANPPADGVPDQNNQFIHTMDGLQLANGSWVIATAMETPDFCTGYVLTSPGSSPPLTIACPTGSGTATTGVLFTSTAPVVTGGTPPDTFTLISGPLWMTINASTGVVSGIPTANGTFTYVIRVTDSLGDIATTSPGCSITIKCPPQFFPGKGGTGNAASAGDKAGTVCDIIPKFQPGKGGNRYGNN